MKAIRTRYLGPTNCRGSRFKADDGDGNSVTVSYDYSLNSQGNHDKVCKALAEKMGWSGDWVSGWIGNDCIYVDTGTGSNDTFRIL